VDANRGRRLPPQRSSGSGPVGKMSPARVPPRDNGYGRVGGEVDRHLYPDDSSGGARRQGMHFKPCYSGLAAAEPPRLGALGSARARNAAPRCEGGEGRNVARTSSGTSIPRWAVRFVSGSCGRAKPSRLVRVTHRSCSAPLSANPHSWCCFLLVGWSLGAAAGSFRDASRSLGPARSSAVV